MKGRFVHRNIVTRAVRAEPAGELAQLTGANRRLSSASHWHATARASGVLKSRKPRLTGFFSLYARSPAKNTTAECVSDTAA